MKFSLSGHDTCPDLSMFNTLDIYKIEGAKNPIYIRQKSMDFLIMNEVFGHECYNADMKNSFHYHDYRRRFGIRTPQNIIDVGAHIGLTSIYYSLKYPNAKIIAIEPEKDNYQMLLKNTSEYKNIIPINSAVSNTKTEMFIIGKESYAKDRYLKSAEYHLSSEKAVHAEKITTSLIDDIIKNYNIDYIDILKIDVEGSEKEIFENNYDLWLSKVKILVFEQHDYKIHGSSKSIFKALCNYNFYYLYDNSDLPSVMMFLIEK